MPSAPPPSPAALVLAPEIEHRRRQLAADHADLTSFYADFQTGAVHTERGIDPASSVSCFEDALHRVGPEHRNAFRAAWYKHLATGEPARIEGLTRRPGAPMLWSACRFEAVRDAEGVVVGMICARQDISRSRAVEMELIEQRLRAEAASQAKSEFLANMSHEIRTPLNGILTMAEVMSHGELGGDQRNLLSIVRQSGQDLLHLLNDILDFSKIEAGRLELEQVEFDPEQVLESTLAAFAAQAERKDLQLWLEIAPQARGLRRGDPARLRQIVSNFVSNSLKFTERGGVRISIEGLGETGRDGLQLAVKDTGLGIAADKMALLFQKFSQIDASTTRRFGGTGLGLAICQELAGLMQGRVWAQSVEGEGSTFYASLSLPYVCDLDAETGEIGGAERSARPLTSLRLLAAEDNPTNQIVLTTIMQVFGVELTVVSNGAEAVEACRAQAFDAILMDVQMPVMDGVQATRAIRAEEAASGRRRTPIIALSANAFHHQVSEYLGVGMDGHVAKPIELNALQAVLERVLASREPDALAKAV